MSVKFANNAFGTLSAGITASGTSITLSSGQGARFPTLASGEYFYATLIDTSNNLEVVKCTARSSDVLTVTRGQESTTAQAFAIGDRIELRVTAAGLTDAANPYDKDTSSTGSFALPVGTTAQQPAAADAEGHIRYDSDDEVVYYSNGTDWLKVSSVIATLSSVTGNIFAGTSTTLTLAGKGFQASNLTVNFLQSSDSIDEDVVVTPTSDVAATVTVPAAVYNNVTSGNDVSISVTNDDGTTSAAVTKTAVSLPSGGTVTTSGGYRYHKFTSSGSFINTVASLSVEYLIVAGGGGGGQNTSAQTGSGGGGAGGLRNGTVSASAQTYSIQVGGGGANGNPGGTGTDSSALGITANGGGGGARSHNGTDNSNNATSGGSGGGGGAANSSNDSYRFGASGTSGQGNSGGNGGYDGSNLSAGGGGGGAGGAGTSGGNAYAAGGTGGAGNGSYSTWATATSSGDNGYYASGGTGGSYNNSSVPSGGWPALDGGGGTGGNGGSPVTANTSGTANTGGGAGGGHVATNGGSGIVLIRYQL